MFLHYRTLGIFLKEEDRGESNRLFTLYTKDFGKIEILGKAIRKIDSKLKYGTEIFNLSEIQFIQGKRYKTLTDVFPIERFDKIKRSLRKLKISYRISGLIESFIKGQELDEDIWGLLKGSLEKLNSIKAKGGTQILFYYYFLWNFVSLLGFAPELYRCFLCKNRITPGQISFSPHDGGLICDFCSGKTEAGKKIDADTVKILRLFMKRDWDTIEKLKISKEHIINLKNISDSYISSISEDRL